MKISKNNVEHFTWGGRCDGWHLLKEAGLSVIQERMPPGTFEVRHYHEFSTQFFYVLKGLVTIELNGEIYLLSPEEGIEVPKMAAHQVFNKSNEDVEFIVVSQPNSKGDRILIE